MVVEFEINTLPNELLYRIFECCYTEYPTSKSSSSQSAHARTRRPQQTLTTFKLSHVCRRWRALLLSSPSRWSSLVVTHARHMNVLNNLLERSQGCELEITLCITAVTYTHSHVAPAHVSGTRGSGECDLPFQTQWTPQCRYDLAPNPPLPSLGDPHRVRSYSTTTRHPQTLKSTDPAFTRLHELLHLLFHPVHASRIAKLTVNASRFTMPTLEHCLRGVPFPKLKVLSISQQQQQQQQPTFHYQSCYRPQIPYPHLAQPHATGLGMGMAPVGAGAYVFSAECFRERPRTCEVVRLSNVVMHLGDTSGLVELGLAHLDGFVLNRCLRSASTVVARDLERENDDASTTWTTATSAASASPSSPGSFYSNSLSPNGGPIRTRRASDSAASSLFPNLSRLHLTDVRLSSIDRSFFFRSFAGVRELGIDQMNPSALLESLRADGGLLPELKKITINGIEVRRTGSEAEYDDF
ncbi:hypothetical protein AMATHDRAFT_50418 [Amanita thiersii Skay4041]|uniref:F-box domain-containing protein n=1 Tax=Amanita thiersii Skay4041 TaxID=703135 RepID=A0A2A9NHU6_9AGAR|nr:hypothetical protein AMATHDRAFT_50418 [Amanita thiersii Skay4041]